MTSHEWGSPGWFAEQQEIAGKATERPWNYFSQRINHGSQSLHGGATPAWIERIEDCVYITEAANNYPLVLQAWKKEKERAEKWKVLASDCDATCILCMEDGFENTQTCMRHKLYAAALASDSTPDPERTAP